VEESESGLRCGKTVRCVHGAYFLAYCLALGSPVDPAEPAVLVDSHGGISHFLCEPAGRCIT
jgi:hypothetical protein